MNEKDFKMTFLCLLILLSLSLLCKKKPEENYLEPVNVSNTPGYSAYPSIAVDSKGTVHLVWTEGVTTPHEQIFYSFKLKGDTWSSPINIPNTPSGARFPDLTVDEDDKLHLAWQQWASDTLGWVIFYSYKPFEGEWLVPETVTRGYWNASPKITVDNTKNVHIVWRYGGYYGGISYRRRNPDGTWMAPEVVLPYPKSIFDYSLATDEEGNVHICWHQMFLDEGKDCIFYSMRSSEGNWTTPMEISVTGSAGSPVCEADRDGDVHFIWNEPKELDDLSYRVRYANGEWSQIEPCSTITYNLASGPDLALGPDNKIYLSWYDHIRGDTTKSICLAKRVDGKWQGRVVAKFTGGRPTLAIDYLENAHLAFEGCVDFRASNYDIFYIEVKKEEQ